MAAKGLKTAFRWMSTEYRWWWYGFLSALPFGVAVGLFIGRMGG